MKSYISNAAVVITLLLVLCLVCPVLSPAGDAIASEEGAVEAAASAVPNNWAFSKFIWASVALMVSVLGTSWAQSRIGVAGAGAMAEKPELAGTFIILIAIPETMVILGFVIAAMLIVM